MLKNIKKFAFEHLLDIGLIILSLVVIFTNVSPSGWTSGWDNLHPEFNPSANIQRAFTTVWQEYQGVGLLGGMGHGADLVRQVVMLPIEALLPVSAIRPLLMSLMLVIGPLGMSLFFRQLFPKKQKLVKLASFLAGVYYLLNLGTVQNFFVPFEPFYWYYGFLPWLFWSVSKALKTGRKSSWIKFALISFIATPLGYLQTAFLTYFLSLMAFLSGSFLTNRKTVFLRRSLKSIITVLVTNLFWLLPVVYFTFTAASVTVNAKINSIATPEVAISNSNFGDIKDVLSLKGYWFNLHDSVGDEFVYVLQPWRDHLTNNTIEIISFALIAIMLIGVAYTFISKVRFKFGLIAVLLLCVVMLTADNPPLGFFLGWISEIIPLFKQIFRSPFTKWVVPTIAIYSTFFGLGFYAIANFAKRIKLFPILAAVTVFISLVIYTKPIFQGELIYINVGKGVPQAYFDLFDYFKTQPKQARIAFYPVQSFWGWNFYDWGYRGSGFLWYGIEQPILDRAFDVWSAQNETFYDEISTAVYANDETLVKTVLDKYDVSYVLIDQSVVIPGGDNKNLRFEQMQEMLSSMGAKLAFEKDFLQVWDVAEVVGNTKQFIYTPDSYIFAKSDSAFSRIDSVFRTNSAYIESNIKPDQIVYPFSSYSAENSDKVNYTNTLDGSIQITLKQTIPANGELVIPAVDPGTQIVASANVSMANKVVKIEFDSMFEVWADGNLVAQANLPVLELPLQQDYSKVIVSIAGKQVELSSNDEKRVSGIVLDPSQNLNIDIFDGNQIDVPTSESFLTSPINTCWAKEGSKGNVIANRAAEILRMSTVDAVGCMAFKLGNFESDKILMNVSLPYISEGVGKPHFCITVEGAPDCVTDDIFYHSSVSHEWSEVSRELVLDGTVPYWMVISARPPDEITGEWAINYKNPQVFVYKKLEGFSFTNLMDGISAEQKIRIPDDTKSLSISVMTSPIDVDIAKSGRATGYNCDVFKRGSVEKVVNGSTVEYKAADLGASCDYAVLGDIRTDQSYLLRVIGENKSGRSSKIYLYNKSNSRNDIEDLLPHGTFDVTYTVLPWVNYDADEYILNTETRSFGREHAVNQIDKISLYQVPINWIAQWHIVPDGAEKQYTNELQISNVKKYGTWGYTAEVKGSGLIILSQGYDSGWVSSNGFEHVKANGWANGFLVDNYDGQITIFYWPQFLQFAGFAVLGVGFVLLLRRKLTK